jgi:hypothetical protein
MRASKKVTYGGVSMAVSSIVKSLFVMKPGSNWIAVALSYSE